MAQTTSRAEWRRSSYRISPLDVLELVEIAQQPSVEQQAEHARAGCGPDHALIAAEVCIHRGNQQPELQDDQDQDEREHAVDNGRALLAREEAIHAHIVLRSTPVA